MSIIKTSIPDYLYHLPEFEPPSTVKRENSNMPDVDSLTPEQKEVYDEIVTFLKGEADPTIRYIVLKGYAGTGKTYVVSQILKWYVLMMQNAISISAPTNKAVKVLRQSANFEHSLITYQTIHKLYGLKEKIDEKTGKQTFEKDWNEPSNVDEIDALIHDETSMLPDDIFNLIDMSLDRNKQIANNRVKEVGSDIDSLLSSINKKTYTDLLRVVFLGDPIQIPPVGKADCIPFNDNNIDEYGIKQLTLSQIIRQKEGNPILDIATIIRNHYQDAFVPYLRESVSNDVGSVSFINSDDKDILYRICEIYFSSDQFNADSDFVKVIAWTNKVVDFMNDKIRSFIYKEKLELLVQDKIQETTAGMFPLSEDEQAKIRKSLKLPRILIGEKLIANSPILKNNGYKVSIEFNTNDEFEVVDHEVKSSQVFDNYSVRIYETKVSYIDYGSGKKSTKTIEILHESSLGDFDKILDTLKKKAIASPKQERGQAWKFFYTMKGKYADVKYNYAITAHKAQGSTYDNAVVITVDIQKNKKVEERNRIMYVAVTRAKTNLFIVE